MLPEPQAASASPYGSGAYHDSRLPADPRRDVLWQSLWRYYFSKRIGPRDCVLDIGAGYGNFINAVVADERIAIDEWPGFLEHLAPGVRGVAGSATNFDFLTDASVDFAFASNLFEHLTHGQLGDLLAALRPKLKPGGTLTIVQPNYRYAFREYFDDYTHVTVYSHVSLADFLVANGYDVIEVRPRFLPLSVKSRLPVWPLLIAAYLWSPFKPGGKQMLVRARAAAGPLLAAQGG